uniref:Uncharacterized protein n=1 Tax=Aegilops tauschii subsp. strangulata TaxID=200361 RepID=A0A453GJM7_AEGTS
MDEASLLSPFQQQQQQKPLGIFAFAICSSLDLLAVTEEWSNRVCSTAVAWKLKMHFAHKTSNTVRNCCV